MLQMSLSVDFCHSRNSFAGGGDEPQLHERPSRADPEDVHGGLHHGHRAHTEQDKGTHVRGAEGQADSPDTPVPRRSRSDQVK